MPERLTPDADLPALFERLHSAYGDLQWWPADTRFEILVGAILVQNTAWTNVEAAIANLRQRDWLHAAALLQVREAALQEALRPSGSFRVKTQRLLALCDWYSTHHGFAALDRWATDDLRESLLEVKGVGRETADAILVYAFERPVFVVDAYTRRVLTRLGWLQTKPSYDELRAVFELTLSADSSRFGQYHALIVEHAKRACRARPLCQHCVLKRQCKAATQDAA